ncbi:rCG37033 [Rattus norvegicus]|uniref:RCG37033 n=1 Tax=Rattus norvegicus TaxID=10116 RepID=A6HUE2_RAT|nr:rCG37033 [Rattus norvegicus]
MTSAPTSVYTRRSL